MAGYVVVIVEEHEYIQPTVKIRFFREYDQAKFSFDQKLNEYANTRIEKQEADEIVAITGVGTISLKKVVTSWMEF